MNVSHVGFRHRNHQTEQIVLREPHQRHRLRAGTGAGLHQCAEIRESLRDHAGEGRRDLRIVEQHLIVLPLGLSGRELALRRLQIRFCGFHLRRGGQSLCPANRPLPAAPPVPASTWRRRSAGRTEVAALCAGPPRGSIRFAACVIWSAAFLIAASSCLNCDCSSGISSIAITWFCLHTRSVVDVELLHIAGFFRVNVDLLERNQFGRKRQVSLQSLPADLDHADGNLSRALDAPDPWPGPFPEPPQEAKAPATIAISTAAKRIRASRFIGCLNAASKGDRSSRRFSAAALASSSSENSGERQNSVSSRSSASILAASAGISAAISRGMREHSVAIAVNQIAGLNLQAADLHRLAEIDDVRIGVRHRNAAGE